MKSILPELLLLVFVLLAVSTCSIYHAGKIDAQIAERIAANINNAAAARGR